MLYEVITGALDVQEVEQHVGVVDAQPVVLPEQRPVRGVAADPAHPARNPRGVGVGQGGDVLIRGMRRSESRQQGEKKNSYNFV